LLQFIQRITKKKMVRIGEPMIPTFGGLANIDPFVIGLKLQLLRFIALRSPRPSTTSSS
jgi:hypothetical protein